VLCFFLAVSKTKAHCIKVTENVNKTKSPVVQLHSFAYIYFEGFFVETGREWSDWSQELRVTGDELRWKFTSDSSVNGWGWRFVVYPIMPSAAPLSMMSDRTVLSRPSIDLATCLLDLRLQMTLAAGGSSVRRLTAALAACAQLGSLSSYLVVFLSHSGVCVCVKCIPSWPCVISSPYDTKKSDQKTFIFRETKRHTAVHIQLCGRKVNFILKFCCC